MDSVSEVESSGLDNLSFTSIIMDYYKYNFPYKFIDYLYANSLLCQSKYFTHCFKYNWFKIPILCWALSLRSYASLDCKFAFGEFCLTSTGFVPFCGLQAEHCLGHKWTGRLTSSSFLFFLLPLCIALSFLCVSVTFL